MSVSNNRPDRARPARPTIARPAAIEPLECRRHMDVTSAAATVSVVMDGLDNPRGLAFGPQGALYVAEAGRGGGVGAPSIVQRGSTFYYGQTGAVSRLWRGEQERAATGLPSLALANGTAAAARPTSRCRASATPTSPSAWRATRPCGTNSARPARAWRPSSV